MKTTAALLLAATLTACVISNVTVRVPSAAPSTTTSTTRVQVNDLRAFGVAANTRQAAFGVPMGHVTFDPPERQLVKDALEAALSRQPATQSAEPYICDIVEFGVNTNTTPLYWDVVGFIRLKLRRNGPDQDLYGTHTERTYFWPGADIITKVVQESLRKAVEGARVSP